MITAKMKTILMNAGCTKVIYESDKLANLFTDESMQYDVIGLLLQQNDITLEVKANAIAEHYQYLTVEVLGQVRLEDQADNNETLLQALLDVCKKIIVYVINDAEFKTIKPMSVTKILETKYDANCIGWSMPLDLYYLKNETRDPCL